MAPTLTHHNSAAAVVAVVTVAVTIAEEMQERGVGVECRRHEEAKESFDDNSAAVCGVSTSLPSRSSSSTIAANGDVREFLRMRRDHCERIARRSLNISILTPITEERLDNGSHYHATSVWSTAVYGRVCC